MSYDPRTNPHNPRIPGGPQHPEKYPYVGDNYRTYGERQGWVYNYPDDSYYLDENAVKDYAKSTGQYRKPPGLLAQIAPLAAAAGGVGLAHSLASDPGGFLKGAAGDISDLFNFGKNLFGFGGPAGASKTLPSVSDIGAALPAAATAATGTFGLGGASAADAAGAAASAGEAGGAAGLASGAAAGGEGASTLLGSETLGAVAPYAIPAIAALGLGYEALKPGGWLNHHGPDYFAGQDRGDLFGGNGLSLPEKGGGTFGLTQDQLTHDPAAYNTQAGNEKYIPQANTIVGINGNADASTLQKQEAAILSNALGAGVNPSQLQALMSAPGTPGAASNASALLAAGAKDSGKAINPLDLIYGSNNSFGIG